MAKEPEKQVDIKEFKLFLDESYQKAGIPQETGDCRVDYLNALDCMNRGDPVGLWMMERLALKSYRPAMALMQILVGAEQGDPQSRLTLGHMYHKGGVLARDLEKAVYYYVLVYRTNPAAVRETLVALLREHRVELYACLRKYPELRQLDREVTVALRRQRELANQEAMRKTLDAARLAQERQAEFARRTDLAHQRRLEEDLARTAEINRQAALAELERRQRREAYDRAYSQELRRTQEERMRRLHRHFSEDPQPKAAQDSSAQPPQFIPFPPAEAREAAPAPQPEKQPEPAPVFSDGDSLRKALEEEEAQRKAREEEEARRKAQEEEEAARLLETRRKELELRIQDLRRRALEQEDTAAMQTLVQLYTSGNEFIPADPEQAEFWSGRYKLAIGDPDALVYLARQYETGTGGLPQNLQKAYDLYVSLGLDSAAARVARQLSNAYITGEFDLPPSVRQSVFWQEKAQEHQKIAKS